MISLPDEEMGNYPSEETETETVTEETAPETVDEENESNASKTILAPKAALGSMTKVGEECMMRVVADHGDEVELEYVTPETESETETMSADEELDSMDKG